MNKKQVVSALTKTELELDSLVDNMFEHSDVMSNDLFLRLRNLFIETKLIRDEVAK